MKKKFVAAGILGAMLVGAAFFPSQSLAAEDTAVEKPAASSSAQRTDAKACLYMNAEYGYSILCPKKPNVIPASALYEGAKGNVLIFDNDGYNIKLAWVVLVDSFEDSAIPNLNAISVEDATKELERIQKTNGYESIGLLKMTPENNAIFAITGKDIEIDSDGDGTVDTVATAENQSAVAFFRGNEGGRYTLQLLNNPQLHPQMVSDFQFALSTFQQISPKILAQYEQAMQEKKKK